LYCTCIWRYMWNQARTHCISSLASRQQSRGLSSASLVSCSRQSHQGLLLKISSNRHALSTMARRTYGASRGYKGGQSSGTGGSRHLNRPQRPRLTHFLCVPLVTETSKPQLEASLRQFSELVSIKFLDGLPPDNTPREFGTPPRAPLISPKAIRPIGTIHFTLGVMSLENEDMVHKAVDLLSSLTLRSMTKDLNMGTEHTIETGMLIALQLTGPNEPS
jgi:hypothetical protein